MDYVDIMVYMDYMVCMWFLHYMHIYIPHTPNIAYRNITYNSLHNTSHYTQHYTRMMKHVEVKFLLIDFLVQWNSLYLGFCDGCEYCRHEARSIRRCNDGTWSRQMSCIRWIRLWIWKRWLPRQVSKWAQIPRAYVLFWLSFQCGKMMQSSKKQHLYVLAKHGMCPTSFACWNLNFSQDNICRKFWIIRAGLSLKSHNPWFARAWRVDTRNHQSRVSSDIGTQCRRFSSF